MKALFAPSAYKEERHSVKISPNPEPRTTNPEITITKLDAASRTRIKAAILLESAIIVSLRTIYVDKHLPIWYTIYTVEEGTEANHNL